MPSPPSNGSTAPDGPHASTTEEGTDTTQVMMLDSTLGQSCPTDSSTRRADASEPVYDTKETRTRQRPPQHDARKKKSPRSARRPGQGLKTSRDITQEPPRGPEPRTYALRVRVVVATAL
jgi:hypothetical protein